MFKDLAKRRYSVRKFKENRIPEQELKEVLEVAMLAPTSQNDQPQRAIVIGSPEAKKKLKNSMKQDYGADRYIVVGYNRNEARKRDYRGIDGGTISATNFANYFMLEAAERGIGTIWVGAFDMDRFADDFDVDDDFTVVGLIAAGYPAENSEPSSDHYSRKDIESVVKFL